MDWIEIIHLRSYSQQDRDEAVTAFQNLSALDRNEALEKISLFRNRGLGNDLSIFLFWRDKTVQSGKSPLGLQLAAAFSDFGQIHHSIWDHETSSTLQLGRRVNEHQDIV
jgi:hypothetical protein